MVKGHVVDTTEETKPINADKWETLSVSDLYEQKIILQERMHTAITMNHFQMAEQIQNGIFRIDNIIQRKTTSESSII